MQKEIHVMNINFQPKTYWRKLSERNLNQHLYEMHVQDKVVKSKLISTKFSRMKLPILIPVRLVLKQERFIDKLFTFYCSEKSMRLKYSTDFTINTKLSTRTALHNRSAKRNRRHYMLETLYKWEKYHLSKFAPIMCSTIWNCLLIQNSWSKWTLTATEQWDALF